MENFIKLIEQCLQCNNTQTLESNLKFIQEMLKFIFEQIKKTNTENEATVAFKILEDIQFVLAKAVFKDKIMTTQPLDEFISDFDRIDDKEVRKFLYFKIKSNEYMR